MRNTNFPIMRLAAILSVAFVMTLFTGCLYDDEDVWRRLGLHDKEIADLKTKLENLNSNISNLQSLVDAAESGKMVTGVTELPDGGGSTAIIIYRTANCP